MVRDVATTDAVTLGTALQVSRRLARQSSRFSVVLSDPLGSCKTESVQALGRTLGNSKVDSLWALECDSHREIGKTLTAMGSEVEVRYFASLEAMRPAFRDNLGNDDVVLIESPRERSLADVTSILIEPLAPTRLYIDPGSSGEQCHRVPPANRATGPASRDGQGSGIRDERDPCQQIAASHRSRPARRGNRG